MGGQFQNAKRFFVTATTGCSVVQLIEDKLAGKCEALVVIEAGGVWLEKTRIVDPNFLLESGQTLRVYFSPFQQRRYVLTPDRIVFEDEQVLVIDKPSGVTSVADRSDRHYNVTYGVQVYLASKGININYAPITRLDFMVSGLMLFAKTPYAVKQLSQKIQRREIHKLYEATLVPKENLPRCIRVKNELSFLQRAYEDPENGRFSHTLFMRAKDHEGSPVYRVILYTGRRHQIRVHAALALSPILGDDLYGEKSEGLLFGLKSVGLNFWLDQKRYRIRLVDVG